MDEGYTVRLVMNVYREDNLSGPKIAKAYLDALKDWPCHQATFRDLKNIDGTDFEHPARGFGDIIYSVNDILSDGWDKEPVATHQYFDIYSYNGKAVAIDENCLQTEITTLKELRYLILKSDGHLYTRWDDPGSIIY
jgi:hypothetical protein